MEPISDSQQFRNDRTYRKDHAALLRFLEHLQTADDLDSPLCGGFPCSPLIHQQRRTFLFPQEERFAFSLG